ncbi:MAG: DUF1573 domain-containing protein [Verrucomicrobiae bacterium]|nr:DUF1573 domain-containing protein [Verrucomicrobiae bacterium]
MRPRPATPIRTAPWLVLPLLLACPPALGQLRWETTQVELTAPPGQTHIAATFRFQNAGPRPVTFFGLKDGCGCSTSNLAERSYAPGEKGDFTLSFTADGRPGHYVRHATLQTDDPYRPNVYLAVMAQIPEVLTFSPPSLQWRVGEPTSEKSIAASLATTPGAQVEAITLSDPSLFALRCEGHGPRRLVSLKPTRTDRPARASIQITVRYGPGIRQTYYAYASIIP